MNEFNFEVGDRVRLTNVCKHTEATIIARYKIELPEEFNNGLRDTNGYLLLLDNSYPCPVYEQDTNGVAAIEQNLEKV